MTRLRSPLNLLLTMAFALPCAAATPHPVQTLKLNILSTMLADGGGTRGISGAPDLLGEWGFSALLESDGHKILIDTGAHADTVLHNARALGLDLCAIDDVVLTHFHPDHIAGLMTLRQSCLPAHPQAFSRVHVATGIFWSHPVPASEGQPAREGNRMIAMRKQYEATGGAFVEHPGAGEIYPGIWLTGPVPRPFPEHNYSTVGTVITPAGPVADTVPDDQSVLVETQRGTVVITGCGHAGAINIVTDARKIIPGKVYVLAGGLHLYDATAKTLDWTGDQLKQAGVQYLLGAHCTGVESVYSLRARIGLTRQTAVVAAVGATFVLNEGIHPGEIAQ